MSMEPLKIEWRFAATWSPPKHMIHFDGFVGEGLIRSAIESDADKELDGDPDEIDVYQALLSDLPFEKHETSTGWCWKASVMRPVGVHGHARRCLTSLPSQSDLVENEGILGKKTSKGFTPDLGRALLDLQRGFSKAFSAFVDCQIADGGEAWCVGDRFKIEGYLAYMDGVGARVSRGFGHLLPYADGKLFRVTPDERANTMWMQRNLPEIPNELPTQTTYWRPHRLALQPPYWNPTVMGYECVRL